jgi:YHS domain-containing protein
MESTILNKKAIDPVCGMNVPMVAGTPLSNYDGVKHYFCAETCRTSFEANPQKYLGASLPKKKGFWQRYLDRLNKATGGKPPSCCG